MSLLTRLYSGNPGLDLRGVWRRALLASLVLVALCAASLLLRGLHLGIDFAGGGVWEVPSEELTVEAVRDALRPVGQDGARIQVLTTATGSRSIRVQAGVEAVDAGAEVARALAEAAGVPVSEVSSTTVGPAWGDEITAAAQRALIYFFAAVALYISVRLEWKMAVAAVVAVLHDIILTVGIYSLFQFTVTPATVIAFLTILGYSLYDTVVVFDKLRESTPLAGTANKMTYTDVANHAANEVVMRSVNTSITSLLPITSILVVGSVALGATTLQEFAIALLVGLAVGTYSSLFVAIPVLVWLKEREPQYAEIHRRLGGHGAAPRVAPAVAGGREQGRSAPLPAPREQPLRSHPPRPRKKGKRR